MSTVEHLLLLERALQVNRGPLERVCDSWGRDLAVSLPMGRRLLVAGNGGSAAQAQHLTAELVGRYRTERQPFSAIALTAETSSVTAIANDYGYEQVFARQVLAHGRPGDTVLLMSTSGGSPNVLAAAAAARDHGMQVWAMTGPAPNDLAAMADSVLAVDAPETATVQELHLVALHLVCECFDSARSEQVVDVRRMRAGAGAR